LELYILGKVNVFRKANFAITIHIIIITIPTSIKYIWYPTIFWC